MEIIDFKILESLTKDAQKSERRRKNMNYHDGESDPVQRMLNAFEPGTYVRPHTHLNPDKREVFIILKGKLLVIFFNEEGAIINHVILDSESEIYAVEIKPGEWHTATGLEPGTVVYEIKDGPYNVLDDKNFAAWAPEEGGINAQYQLKQWLDELHLDI
ncbi:WbuC family cupin fold metalloprotein [Plebeiibacterium sediminum]|uniref:WbuC family cupin fold metalloprotein n=1 Tax=Plebeiibacterium sediminum TaxID=2992112 RepID=A0AAE3M845_9BACT|nr:WbuC family cupin fold metalloprotein [Plebeiobacterium sediminum]MCW3788570.1 WbuC family cupin fold metalloprotein [Plebeiobacterium sediminum]